MITPASHRWFWLSAMGHKTNYKDMNISKGLVRRGGGRSETQSVQPTPKQCTFISDGNEKHDVQMAVLSNSSTGKSLVMSLESHPRGNGLLKDPCFPLSKLDKGCLLLCNICICSCMVYSSKELSF